MATEHFWALNMAIWHSRKVINFVTVRVGRLGLMCWKTQMADREGSWPLTPSLTVRVLRCCYVSSVWVLCIVYCTKPLVWSCFTTMLSSEYTPSESAFPGGVCVTCSCCQTIEQTQSRSVHAAMTAFFVLLLWPKIRSAYLLFIFHHTQAATVLSDYIMYYFFRKSRKSKNLAFFCFPPAPTFYHVCIGLGISNKYYKGKMQNKSQVTASEQGVVPPPTRKHQCLFTVNRSFVGASEPTEAAGKQTSNSSSQVWWFHSFELRVLRHVINLSISPMCSSIKIISAWKPDASFLLILVDVCLQNVATRVQCYLLSSSY